MNRLLTPTIIVVEQGELWLAALRTSVRRSAATPLEPAWLHVTLREEAASAIVGSRAPFIVLQVSSNTAANDVLELDRWRETCPEACMVAAVDRTQEVPDVRKLALALWEAGAAHVLTSPRRAAEALPLLQRHWKRAHAAGEVNLPSWNHQTAGLSELPACWRGE